nr:NAD(P)-dependent oxidoreductase [Kineococcus siccus]
MLVTGSSGGMGRLLRERLARPGRVLRLLDLAHPDDVVASPDLELRTGSVTDPAVVARALDGADAVLHLAGISVEGPWPDVLDVNVHGTWCVLDAASRTGARVLLASSNHAVGMLARADAGPQGVPADAPPRPDTYYGWSKTAGESLGRMYADRTGLDVVALRIGSCFAVPTNVRALSTWLSPDDAARLVEACLAAPSPGFRTVWGISRNTRRWFSLAEGEALGYHPLDDAERFAADVLARAEPDEVLDLVGGGFTEYVLGTTSRPPRP